MGCDRDAAYVHRYDLLPLPAKQVMAGAPCYCYRQAYSIA